MIGFMVPCGHSDEQEGVNIWTGETTYCVIPLASQINPCVGSERRFRSYAWIAGGWDPGMGSEHGMGLLGAGGKHFGVT